MLLQTHRHLAIRVSAVALTGFPDTLLKAHSQGKQIVTRPTFTKQLPHDLPLNVAAGNTLTSTTNEAYPDPSGHNNGQKGADSQYGTVSVPVARHTSACLITLTKRPGGRHHQLFSPPPQSIVNASTASNPGHAKRELNRESCVWNEGPKRHPNHGTTLG